MGEGRNFSFFIGKKCKVYLRSDVAGERTLWGKDSIFLFLFIGKTCKVYLRIDVAGERTLWGKDAIFFICLKCKVSLEVMWQVKGLCGGRTQFFFFLMAKSVRFILEVVLQVKVLCGGRTQFFFFYWPKV